MPNIDTDPAARLLITLLAGRALVAIQQRRSVRGDQDSLKARADWCELLASTQAGAQPGGRLKLALVDCGGVVIRHDSVPPWEWGRMWHRRHMQRDRERCRSAARRRERAQAAARAWTDDRDVRPPSLHG